MSSLDVSIAEGEVRIYCQSFMKVDTEPLTTLLTILLFNGVHGIGEWGMRNHSFGDTIWQYRAIERYKEAEKEMLGFRSHQIQRSRHC